MAKIPLFIGLFDEVSLAGVITSVGSEEWFNTKMQVSLPYPYLDFGLGGKVK